MKTSLVLSAVSFALVIATPACSGKFASLGDIDAGLGGGTAEVGGAGHGTGGASGLGGSSGVTCLYNNVNYAIGSTFKSSDSCNTCSCTSSGQVACTAMACLATGGSSGVGGSTGTGCVCSGPAPGAPNVICWDGSMGGPVCETNSTGSCSWQIRSCPPNPGSGGATGAGGSTGVTCVYNNVNYPPGTIPVNTCCVCGADGSIACANNTACNNKGTGGSSGVGGSTGTSSCVTAADCKGALPALCQQCSNGSSGCAHFVCNSGNCDIAYCDSTTCLYNGVNYAPGSNFKSTDGCNTCSCTSSGAVVCTERACQVGSGGASSVGGAGQGGSTSCPAIPLAIPKCDNGTAILKYDPSTGCPTGYGCPTCPTVNLPNISCSNYQIVTDPTTGCATGYTCPTVDASTCPPIALVVPVCPNGTAVLKYDPSTGCATGYGCP